MWSDHATYEPRRRGCGKSTGNVYARAAILNAASLTRDPHTKRALRTWSAGDYDRVAAGLRHEAHAFVKRRALMPGQCVLDLACGSGNVTIPAARTGAGVAGLDLVPALLDAAAAWSAREGVPITLDQGTVEELPYDDAQFDVVTSMFGVMYAPRPERVVDELLRVTRPGGRIALANWTRDGFFGRMLATQHAYVPPPVGLWSPLLWGDEQAIRDLFDRRLWLVATAVRTLTFRYPHSPSETADLFRTAHGPTVRALESLDAARAARLAGELALLWGRHQRPGADGTEVAAEYLEVVAIKR